MRSGITAGVFAIACSATLSLAAPTTWEIDTPWEFYTANTAPQTSLVGTITFDRDVSNFYPSEWSLQLVHFDPVFDGHYPITIEGSYPSISDAQGVGWVFRNDILTGVTFNFGFDNAILDVLLDGTQSSVAFAADEYVQHGPFSSQRRILNGTAALVPTPGVAAIFAVAGVASFRKRR